MFMNAVNQNEANLVKDDAGILPVFSSAVLAHDMKELNMFLGSCASWQRCWQITWCTKQDDSRWAGISVQSLDLMKDGMHLSES